MIEDDQYTEHCRARDLVPIHIRLLEEENICKISGHFIMRRRLAAKYAECHT